MTSAVHSQTRTQRPCRGGFLTSHSRRHDVRKVIDFRFVTSKVRSIDGFWLRIGWSFLFFNSFFLFFVCCLLTGTYKFPFSSMDRCLTQLGKFSGRKKKVLEEKERKVRQHRKRVENYEWKGTKIQLRVSENVLACFKPVIL